MSFKNQWNRDKLDKKTKKGFRGYPIATIAFYGPDDKRASKVALTIVAYDGAEPDPLERLFSETDVRTDPQVIEAILEFIKRNSPKSVVATDRIIGCPHEEAIDYPRGEKCPECPFWATRNRWSGEIEN